MAECVSERASEWMRECGRDRRQGEACADEPAGAPQWTGRGGESTAAAQSPHSHRTVTAQSPHSHRAVDGPWWQWAGHV